MTEISGRIKRKAEGRSDTYTVEIAAEGIYIREAGSRTTYGPVSWDLIYLKGGELQARQNRLEQQTSRSIRKVTRNLLTT